MWCGHGDRGTCQGHAGRHLPPRTSRRGGGIYTGHLEPHEEAEEFTPAPEQVDGTRVVTHAAHVVTHAQSRLRLTHSPPSTPPRVRRRSACQRQEEEEEGTVPTESGVNARPQGSVFGYSFHTHPAGDGEISRSGAWVTVTPFPKAGTAGEAGGSLWERPLGPDNYGEAVAGTSLFPRHTPVPCVAHSSWRTFLSTVTRQDICVCVGASSATSRHLRLP